MARTRLVVLSRGEFSGSPATKVSPFHCYPTIIEFCCNFDCYLEFALSSAQTFSLGSSASIWHDDSLSNESGFLWSQVMLAPVTGRRHQLRIHCHRLGNTIVGDFTYSGKRFDKSLQHAKVVIYLPRCTCVIHSCTFQGRVAPPDVSARPPASPAHTPRRARHQRRRPIWHLRRCSMGARGGGVFHWAGLSWHPRWSVVLAETGPRVASIVASASNAGGLSICDAVKSEWSQNVTNVWQFHQNVTLCDAFQRCGWRGPGGPRGPSGGLPSPPPSTSLPPNLLKRKETSGQISSKVAFWTLHFTLFQFSKDNLKNKQKLLILKKEVNFVLL